MGSLDQVQALNVQHMLIHQCVIRAEYDTIKLTTHSTYYCTHPNKATRAISVKVVQILRTGSAFQLLERLRGCVAQATTCTTQLTQAVQRLLSWQLPLLVQKRQQQLLQLCMGGPHQVPKAHNGVGEQVEAVKDHIGVGLCGGQKCRIKS